MSTFVARNQSVTIRTAFVNIAIGMVSSVRQTFARRDCRNKCPTRRPAMNRAQAE